MKYLLQGTAVRMQRAWAGTMAKQEPIDIFPSYPLPLLMPPPGGPSFPKATSEDQVFKHRSLMGVFHYEL